MERAEAEAIYDSGRERCVEVILELAGAVERLEERIRRLEEQLRKDSRNSSAPPSEDPPKTRAERRAEARRKAKLWARDQGQRKQGGQPGHEGSGRKLRPEDQLDEVVDHYPQACRGCGRAFTDDERRPRRRFGRHQVAELPELAIIYSEHRSHRLSCPACGARTTALLPDAIGSSSFGPNLQAAIVTLTARNRISRRDMSELALDLFGLGVATGAVDAICQRAALALEGPHAALCASVLGAPALGVDETGWFTAAAARTLWTAVTERAAIFRVAEDRHRDRLEELIGKDFGGILGSDRWWAY